MFLIRPIGCYFNELLQYYPFKSQLTPMWRRFLIRNSNMACLPVYFEFYFNLQDVREMSFALDDIRIDRCYRLDPPSTTTAVSQTTTITKEKTSTTTKNSAIRDVGTSFISSLIQLSFLITSTIYTSYNL